MSGLAILGIFVVAAGLMFRRVLPALLALPLMAVAIAGVEVAAGRLTLMDLAQAVVADGSVRLAEPMVIAMMGGMVSQLLHKTGVARNLVRVGAELAGDNPWLVALGLLGVVALLFTSIGGLGAVIMVGTITLPILASLGIRDTTAAGVLLFGITLGGILNPGNWAVYQTVLQLDRAVVSQYALTIFATVALGAVVFVLVESWRSGTLRPLGWLGWSVCAVGGVGLASVGFGWLPALSPAGLHWLTGVAGLGIVASLATDQWRQRPGLGWYAYLTPLVPLILILVFQIPSIPAFGLGFVYGLVTTWTRGGINRATGAMLEGSASVMAAVVLMVGIGMLLSAVLGPTRTGPGAYWYTGAEDQVWPVVATMQPLLAQLVPQSRPAYVVLFALLGPLALYRGPLNVWGLGYGIGGVMLAAGLPAGAVMGVLMSLGVIQGVSDPTNTHNVWLANEVRVDVNALLWRTLPYAWGIACVGLVLAAGRFLT
ncbi:MAG: citrate transporter [Gloeomargaritaceae cyanobacterium C42_A2020_066]|nr:citrate transporter [Gloeomargaritaceae cyanobacterium C42_A2020_066]